MLTPTKHTNIKFSVIYIAGKILSYLHNYAVLTYDEVQQMLANDLGQKAKTNLGFSLIFLYSIGKVEYLKKIDAITIIDNNNED
ncbi:MAG: ABC-three component system middle component 8 [Polaribacter sp.]